jgi:hypothetical protein
MRCPDCSKFVSMDNQAEVDDSSVSYAGTTVDVTIEVTGKRVCADCSTELKSLTMIFEDTLFIESLDELKALTPEQQKLIIYEAAVESLEVEIEADEPDVEEGGGGRYKKNMITTTVHFTLTFTTGDGTLSFKHSGSLSQENQASSYEECC